MFTWSLARASCVRCFGNGLALAKLVLRPNNSLKSTLLLQLGVIQVFGMSSFAFEAQSVAMAHPDGEFHLVGFADREFNTKTYLMLQRALDFDEQDVALGMDTYHVEWCGQENSGYGGITRFSLQSGCAEIEFTQDVAEALDGMQRLTITFRLTPFERLALKKALGHIFEGSDCLFVVEA